MTADHALHIESDRVFIIDHDCFIIYTGSGYAEQRPFIRLGSSHALPREVIPLIDCIVLSEKVCASPQAELFNIDSVEPSKNRYFGSKQALDLYFTSLSSCGFSHINEATVSTESDLPEINSNMNVPGDGQFSGIFSPNGNFKLLCNGVPLLDLSETQKTSFSRLSGFDIISSLNRTPEIEGGISLSVIGNSLSITSGGRTILAGYPHDDVKAFASSPVDPGGIEHILLPRNQPVYSVFPLSTWQRQKGTACSLQVHHLGNRLRSFTQQNEKLKELKPPRSIGIDRVTVDFLPGGFELFIASQKNRVENVIRIVFAYESKLIKDAVHRNPDAVITSYELFSSNALLFSGSPVQVVLYGDSIPQERLSPGVTLLHPGIKYCPVKLSKGEEIHLHHNLPLQSASLVSEGDEETILSMIESTPADTTFNYNLKSLISFHQDATPDRARFAVYKRLLQEISKHLATSESLHPRVSEITLSWYGSRIYEFIKSHRDEVNLLKHMELSDRITSASELIDRDRERLKLLITRLDGQVENSDYDNKMMRLSEEHERLNQIIQSSPLPDADQDATRRSVNKTISLPASWLRSKASILFAAALLFAIPALLVLLLSEKSVEIRLKPGGTLPHRPSLTETEKLNYKALPDAFRSEISPVDIYRIANRIAATNGYAELSDISKQGKDPNWIYPANVLKMPDNSKITVQPGDTLWSISRDRLIYSDLRLYRIFTKLNSGKESSFHVHEDELIAFTDTQQKLLAKILEWTKKNTTTSNR